jgi:hypothetical protein
LERRITSLTRRPATLLLTHPTDTPCPELFHLYHHLARVGPRPQRLLPPDCQTTYTSSEGISINRWSTSRSRVVGPFICHTLVPALPNIVIEFSFVAFTCHPELGRLKHHPPLPVLAPTSWCDLVPGIAVTKRCKIWGPVGSPFCLPFHQQLQRSKRVRYGQRTRRSTIAWRGGNGERKGGQM